MPKIVPESNNIHIKTTCQQIRIDMADLTEREIISRVQKIFRVSNWITSIDVDNLKLLFLSERKIWGRGMTHKFIRYSFGKDPQFANIRNSKNEYFEFAYSHIHKKLNTHKYFRGYKTDNLLQKNALLLLDK